MLPHDSVSAYQNIIQLKTQPLTQEQNQWFWEPMQPDNPTEGAGLWNSDPTTHQYFWAYNNNTRVDLKRYLTPIQKLQNIFLSSKRRVVAFIKETDEYIQ